MALESPPITEEWISVASGRLRWKRVGDAAVRARISLIIRGGWGVAL